MVKRPEDTRSDIEVVRALFAKKPAPKTAEVKIPDKIPEIVENKVVSTATAVTEDKDIPPPHITTKPAEHHEKHDKVAVKEKTTPTHQDHDHKNTGLHEMGKSAKSLIAIGEPWIDHNFSDEKYKRVVDNLKFRESGGLYNKEGRDKHNNPYYGQLQLGATQMGIMGCPTHKETIHVKVKDKEGHVKIENKVVDRVDAGFLNDFLNNKNGVQDIVNENWLKYNAGSLVQTGADKYIGKDIYFGKEGHRQFLCTLTAGEALTAINLSGPGSPDKHTGFIGFLQGSDKDYHPKAGHDANSSDGHVTIAQYVMVGMVAEFNTSISFDDIRKETNRINQKLHKNPDYNVSTALAALTPQGSNNYAGVHPDDMVHIKKVQDTMKNVTEEYLKLYGTQQILADNKGTGHNPTGRGFH